MYKCVLTTDVNEPLRVDINVNRTVTFNVQFTVKLRYNTHRNFLFRGVGSNPTSVTTVLYRLIRYNYGILIPLII